MADADKIAELEAQIAANEARMQEIRADQDRWAQLAPIRSLRALADQAAKEPESVDWAEAVKQLEAALEVARAES